MAIRLKGITRAQGALGPICHLWLKVEVTLDHSGKDLDLRILQMRKQAELVAHLGSQCQ